MGTLAYQIGLSCAVVDWPVSLQSIQDEVLTRSYFGVCTLVS